jgi:hypothetical protein
MRQQLRRAFAFHGGQQYRQQAAHDAAFAVAEEVQLLAGDAHAQPDAVFTAGNLFRLRFEIVRKRGNCLPSKISWRYLSSHCERGEGLF